MHFSIEKADLARACAALSGAVESRVVIPILANALIEAAENTVTLTATNLDRMVSVTVPAHVSARGMTTASFLKLKSIADSAPDGAEIDFATDAGEYRLIVKAARSRVSLLTLDAADFPEFPGPKGGVRFSLKGAELEQLLSVVVAASNEETRYYLNGIYLHTNSRSELVSVATNGHMLLRTSISQDEPFSFDLDPGVIIPSEAITHIKSLISDSDVIVACDGSKVSVGIERSRMTVRFVTKVVDGTYPDYERVIPPAKFKLACELDTSILSASIKRALVASSKKDSSVALVRDTAQEPGALTISARSDEGEESEDAFVCQWTGDTSIRIGVNSRYLLAISGALGTKEIVLKFTDATSGIRLETPADPAHLAVIMPVRI